MNIAFLISISICLIQTGSLIRGLNVDDELIEDIEDFLAYKEELGENEEKETDYEDDSKENFINDVDDADSGILPPSNKRFDSFFDQRAREKFLIQNIPTTRTETKPDETFRKVKTKRSRESTLKQLIKLCKGSDEQQQKPVMEEQRNSMRRVMQKFSTAPVYGKRFGSILDQQTRAKNLMQKVNYTMRCNLLYTCFISPG